MASTTLIEQHNLVCSSRINYGRFTGTFLKPVNLRRCFSGFSTIISSFGFNRLGSKLVGMFFEIVSMFVAKGFVRHRFVAQIYANSTWPFPEIWTF